MRHILIALILGFSISAFSQSYKISDLVQIGDSVVNSTIGGSYYNYYKLDTNSYYIYYDWIKKEKKHQIVGQNTKGKFKEISLRYEISYPEIKELSSTLYILIDNALKVEKFTSDIPDFILENKPVTFIKKEKVVAIGDSLLKEKGLKIEYSLYKEYFKGLLHLGNRKYNY